MDSTDAQQKFDSQSSSNGGGNAEGGNSNSGPFMHQVEHSGVTCDICSGKISGFRYKCMQCPDFDLCRNCEAKGHHPGHLVLRISFPEQAQEAYQRYFHGAASSGHGGAHDLPFHFRNGCSFKGRGGFGGRGHCGRGRGGQGWGEFMRKAAQDYNNAFGAAAAAEAAQQSTENGQAAGGAPDFDCTAAKLQIQELLNAWGVPVNVDDFCGQFGAGASGNATGSADAKDTSKSSENTTGSDVNMEPPSTSTAAPPSAPQEPLFGANGANPLQGHPLHSFLSNAMQNPQVQQIIQGVASAAETAARNIPTPTQMPTTPSWPDFFGTQPAAATSSIETSSSIDHEKNTATLNQLLSMGFSNHDGWLERLVIAKKGHLEAVLNSLFPGGAPSSK